MSNSGDNLFLEENYTMSDDSIDSEETVDSSEQSDFGQLRSGPRVMRVESDSEGDTVIDWNDNDPPRQNEPFEGLAGVKFDTTNMRPEGFAEKFIGDDLFRFIVDETNRYYYQNSYKYKVDKKSKKWVDVTVPEIKKWFGLLVIMGIVKKGALDLFLCARIAKSHYTLGNVFHRFT